MSWNLFSELLARSSGARVGSYRHIKHDVGERLMDVFNVIVEGFPASDRFLHSVSTVQQYIFIKQLFQH